MSELALPPPRPVSDQSPQALLWNATLGWLEHQRSGNTREAYQRGLLGVGPTGKAAEMKFPAWLPWLRAQGIGPLEATVTAVDLYGRLMREAGTADRSQAQRLAVVSSWYKWLQRQDLAGRNPAEHATRPNIDPADTPTIGLTMSEVDKLVAAARDDSLLAVALVLLLYLGAFRIGSLITCDVADYRPHPEEPLIRLRVKGAAQQTVGLDQVAAEALTAYLDSRRAHGPLSPAAPLFVNLRGGRIDNPWTWRLLRSLAAAAKVTEVSPHGLRHTHVDHALEEGVDIVTISDTLGHADIKMTEHYRTALGRRKAGRRSGASLAAGLAERAASGED